MALSGLSCAGVDLALEAPPPFAGFVCDYGRGYLTPTAVPPNPAAEVLITSGQALGGTIVRTASVQGEAEAAVRWDGQAKRLHLDMRAPGDGHLLLATRAIRALLTKLLLERGAVAIHAAAVAVDGRATCFVADKEHGKTTALAVSLRAGSAMIANDTVYVERGARGLTARGLPVAAGIRRGTVELFPELLALAGDAEKLHWENRRRGSGDGGAAAKLFVPPARLAAALGTTTVGGGDLGAFVELVLDPRVRTPSLRRLDRSEALEAMDRHHTADPLRHAPALRDLLEVQPAPTSWADLAAVPVYRLTHGGQVPIDVPGMIEGHGAVV